MNTIILHSRDLKVANEVASELGCPLKEKSAHFRFSTKQNPNLNYLRKRYQLDFNYLPKAFDFNAVALFVSDMDSTLITIESIDELADFANVKPQVAAITQRAMRGELEFSRSLIERLALLKGLDVEVLNRVYTERLEVSPGGEELIRFFKNQGIKTAVISGGFDYFTQRLAADIGLDHQRANPLNIENNKLTGTTNSSIINAQSKADFVNELCTLYAISPEQVIAAGDGANDLLMMNYAGLSVAYMAKSAVQKQANIVINFAGLDKIKDFFNE